MVLTDRLKSGWTVLKIIRVVLGILILSSSITEHQVPGIVLGALFTLFALFTDGVCCAGGNCYAPQRPGKIKETDTIEYEELGAEK